MGLAGNGYADLQKELLRFGETEEKVVTSFNNAIQKAQTGSISDGELASILKNEILAPWKTARAEFEGIENLPKQQIELHRTFVQYMNLREQGWQLLLEALEGDDEEKMKSAMAKQAEAQAILEKIEKGK